MIVGTTTRENLDIITIWVNELSTQIGFYQRLYFPTVDI